MTVEERLLGVQSTLAEILAENIDISTAKWFIALRRMYMTSFKVLEWLEKEGEKYGKGNGEEVEPTDRKPEQPNN